MSQGGGALDLTPLQPLIDVLTKPENMGNLEALLRESYKFIRLADDLHDIKVTFSFHSTFEQPSRAPFKKVSDIKSSDRQRQGSEPSLKQTLTFAGVPERHADLLHRADDQRLCGHPGVRADPPLQAAAETTETAGALRLTLPAALADPLHRPLPLLPTAQPSPPDQVSEFGGCTDNESQGLWV